MYDYRVTIILVCVILFVKLIFWSIWFCYRKKRQQRMLEAGLVRPAQPVVSGATLPRTYNTQYWQPAVQTISTAPPAYETVAETGTGKQGLPPSYQEAVRAK